eukprot:TRINITY_DN24027_c0_g1_i1.p1 TRINITY_DN24027_c0_g1~~TRINITY_DN24027_c0_g1_i1.p1  ORF type:complete len:797 (+),score=206.68 TRINITY_DN24027_c0_g1_i1:93-2393(+)
MAGGGGDLLDLDFHGGGAAGNGAPAKPAAEPAAATASTTSGNAADALGEDWDDFQSAFGTAPAQNNATTGSAAGGYESAPVPAAPSAAVAPAQSAVTGSAPAADDVVGSFDPILNPVQAQPPPAGVLTTTDLGALDSLSKGKGGDNLISFGVVDEFDPIRPFVEQEAGNDGHAPPVQDSATQSAPASEVVQAAPTPAAPAQTPEPAPAPVAAPAPELVAATVPEYSYTTKEGESDLLGLGGPAPANRAAPAQAAPGEAEPAAAAAASAGETRTQPEGVVEEGGVPVEDIIKKVIYVYHKGEKNVVGWYADMEVRDIREAVMCACDAIMDGGFVLREVQFVGDDETSAEPKEDGKMFQFEEFHLLENGQTYLLESAKEREDLKDIMPCGGDRWRRLKVQIEPLLHVEANKAIERMRRGSNLLKHTHYGFPHLRQFQLSDDRKRLVWYSGAKRKEDSVIQLDEVTEIRLGQTTPVFLHYRLPMLEHLSFSLVYGGKGVVQKTLDLTCKDEFEFDHWVTGLKAVFYHFKNRQISKEQLLGHSKRFRKALEKNNVCIKLTKLPEVKEKGHVGLDDCIEIVTHTPQQRETKMDRLRERLRLMNQQVARLDHHAAAETEMDLSLLTGQGPAYASVFLQDEDVQDEEMEIRRMNELVEQTTQILHQARNELIALNQRQKNDDSATGAEGEKAAAKGKKKENAACKHIDQLLWKAEVDLENVEDMYLRHVDNQKETKTPFPVSVAEMNQRITRTASDIEEAFSKGIEDMKNWFR